ncbi:hypothetical protein MASR2M15_28560 [Anaerolineales bacterium]
MQIDVIFFGRLKSDTQVKQVRLKLKGGENILALEAELARRYPALQAQFSSIAYAANDQLVSKQYQLQENDQIALLPPVSGG